MAGPLQALNEPIGFQRELVVLPELFVYGLHESLVTTWNEVVGIRPDHDHTDSLFLVHGVLPGFQKVCGYKATEGMLRVLLEEN